MVNNYIISFMGLTIFLIMGKIFKLSLFIIAILIIGSCSQYRKVSCPVYPDNFNTHRVVPAKHKSVRLKKSVNSAYRSFYKTRSVITKNPNRTEFGKSIDSVLTMVYDSQVIPSGMTELYASNDNAAGLKNSLISILKNQRGTAIGKSNLIRNKYISRKDFKKDLRREIKKINSDYKNIEEEAGVKLARQSSLFGIISIGSYLLLAIPYASYVIIPAIILFSVLAIVRGKTALGMLDKANYKSVSKARTGKTLGIISLILLGIMLLLAFIFLLFLIAFINNIPL